MNYRYTNELAIICEMAFTMTNDIGKEIKNGEMIFAILEFGTNNDNVWSHGCVIRQDAKKLLINFHMTKKDN